MKIGVGGQIDVSTSWHRCQSVQRDVV